MIDTAIVYWFSKEGLDKLNTCYEKLTNRKNKLYLEINECLQMDHHDQAIKSQVVEHCELKRILQQIDAIKPFIRVVESPTVTIKQPVAVQIYTAVTVQYDENEIQRYVLTAYGETDLSKNKISYTTALGKHLLGKRLNETFLFTHHAFTQKVTILDIQYT